MKTRGEVESIAAEKCDALKLRYPTSYEVSEVEQFICNYCNISEVPHALRFVWANLLVDYILWEKAVRGTDGADAQDSTPKVVKSIREGDAEVTFTLSEHTLHSKALGAHNLQGVLDSFTLNHADALNKFRRLVW